MANHTDRYTSVFSGTGQKTVIAQPHNQRMTYAYDEVGQRRSMDATGSGRFTYQYDAAGQITALQNPFSERTTFGYDDAGRRTVQRNANGIRTSLAYDAANQHTQIHHRKSDGTSLLQLDYQYGDAGNRTVMAENGSTARTTWTYGAENQLLGEHRTGTHAYRQTFTFDPVGNRTLKNADGTRTTFAYDNANQLIYGQTGSDRTTFTFDADGNQHIEQPATGNRTTTTWNFENQPTQYLLPSGSPVPMTYNPDNRRVAKQQDTDVTKFVWDEPIDAYLSELDSLNAVQAVYTNEPVNYGRIISQRRGTDSRWYQTDALGSTRLLTNSTQTTSDTYLYDAWGVPLSSTGTTVNPIRWVGAPGYFYDSETGLFYVRARMYQPTMATWCSVDPIAAESYLYGQSNAVNHVDPSGLFVEGVSAGPWVVDLSRRGVRGLRDGKPSYSLRLNFSFDEPRSLPGNWPRRPTQVGQYIRIKVSTFSYNHLTGQCQRNQLEGQLCIRDTWRYNTRFRAGDDLYLRVKGDDKDPHFTLCGVYYRTERYIGFRVGEDVGLGDKPLSKRDCANFENVVYENLARPGMRTGEDYIFLRRNCFCAACSDINREVATTLFGAETVLWPHPWIQIPFLLGPTFPTNPCIDSIIEAYDFYAGSDAANRSDMQSFGPWIEQYYEYGCGD